MNFPDRTVTPRPNTAIPAPRPPRPLSFSGPINEFQAEQPTYEESVYSREDTPLPGIDLDTVREIRKRFDSDAKIADVVNKAIEAYMGGNVGVDSARVAQIITKIVEDQVLHNIGGTNVRAGPSVLWHIMIYRTCTPGESKEVSFLIPAIFQSILPIGFISNSISSSTPLLETRMLMFVC